MNKWGRFLGWTIRFILGIAILAAAVLGLRWQLRTTRHAKQIKPKKDIIPVTVITTKVETRTTTVRATGQILPSRQLDLSPQIAGKIIEISPNLEPGGVFHRGEVLLRIEPDDFAAAVVQAEARLTEALTALRLEQGRGKVAQHEWEMLPTDSRQDDVKNDLLLRRPQLQRSEAAVKAAKSSLAQAKRNLTRTTVRAPFDCVILKKSVELGQQISPQTRLLSLVGIRRWWVDARIPFEDLAWIQLPDSEGNGGATATITRSCQGRILFRRHGRIVRLMRDLNPTGRLAQVLIEVKNPLKNTPQPPAAADKKQRKKKNPQLPLMLHDYVDIAINGRILKKIIALPRPLVREGDLVWCASAENTLEIRRIFPVWRTRKQIWVQAASPADAQNGKGILPGEKIITSMIPAALPGMLLQILGPQPPEPPTGPAAANPSMQPEKTSDQQP